MAEKEKRRLLRGHDRRCMAFFYALFICQSLGSAWRILFLFTTTAETAAAVATTMPAYQADNHTHTHTCTAHTHAHVQCVHVHIGPHSRSVRVKKRKQTQMAIGAHIFKAELFWFFFRAGRTHNNALSHWAIADAERECVCVCVCLKILRIRCMQRKKPSRPSASAADAGQFSPAHYYQ